MDNHDTTIYTLRGGKMVRVGEPQNKHPGAELRDNFVIVCDYGDWSGFRTLLACERQFPELEHSAWTGNRPDGFYRVVERL